VTPQRISLKKDGCFPDSHHGVQTQNAMWDLWWKKCHWNRFLKRIFRLSVVSMISPLLYAHLFIYQQRYVIQPLNISLNNSFKFKKQKVFQKVLHCSLLERNNFNNLVMPDNTRPDHWPHFAHLLFKQQFYAHLPLRRTYSSFLQVDIAILKVSMFEKLWIYPWVFVYVYFSAMCYVIVCQHVAVTPNSCCKQVFIFLQSSLQDFSKPIELRMQYMPQDDSSGE
jgi:hypothetical protein